MNPDTQKSEIPSRYCDPITGKYDYTLVEKSERCRLANCLSLAENNPLCAKCQGPVVWVDHEGKEHGRCRSCANCPMNNLGLSVCLSACAGPTQCFQTDGQSIVTIGRITSNEEFMDEFRERRTPAERVITTLNERDPNSPITEKLNLAEEKAAIIFLSKLIHISGNTWERVKSLLKIAPSRAEDLKNKRECAAILGIPVSTLLDPKSPARQTMNRLQELDSLNWEIIRLRITKPESSSAEIARLLLLTKQAVSFREKQLEAKWAWFRRLKKSIDKANDKFFSDSGVDTPRKAEGESWEAEGYEDSGSVGNGDAPNRSKRKTYWRR